MSYARLKHILAGIALEAIEHPGHNRAPQALLAFARRNRGPRGVSLAVLARAAGMASDDAERTLAATTLFDPVAPGGRVVLAAPFQPFQRYLRRQVARVMVALRLVSVSHRPAIPDEIWRAAALFNAGLFFECHEHLEDVWRAASPPERAFYHGLVQAAAGCYHFEKGNAHGARTLIEKAIAKLAPYAPAHRAVDLGIFIAGLRRVLARLARRGERRAAGRRALPFLPLVDAPSAAVHHSVHHRQKPVAVKGDLSSVLESPSNRPQTPGAGMDRVFQYIDAHRDAYIELLRRLCRQPSIAAQGIGLEETASLVVGLMGEAGIRARLVPLPDGAPVVYGEARGRIPRTLMFYNHYDVQPPEPLEAWADDPFAAAIRDGKIYARGVADNKGNLVARICAVDAMLQVLGELPAGVRFVVEGEEEIGSVHLQHFVGEHPDLVTADACIWEAGYRDLQENIVLALGVKGICYVELEARGANRDLHSSVATIVPNPAWRLIWALATFKDRNERILIDGFYDDVVEPTDEEMNQLRRLAPLRDDAAQHRDYGLDRFLLGVSGVELLKRNLFQPTCTICGIASGYGGPGSKTVLPHKAVAKVDFRLVANQRADDIFQKIQAHLAQQGFADISSRALGNEDPAKTPLSAEIVRIVSESVRRVYHREPQIYPSMAGTGPMAVLNAGRRIPTVGSGVGYARSNGHAPNENIRIGDYIEGIKHIAMVLHLFAGGR